MNFKAIEREEGFGSRSVWYSYFSYSQFDESVPHSPGALPACIQSKSAEMRSKRRFSLYMQLMAVRMLKAQLTRMEMQPSGRLLTAIEPIAQNWYT